MAFFTAFGLGGENTFAHSHASPSGASPKPSAATNRTAREKYGLEAIIENRTLLFQATSLAAGLAIRRAQHALSSSTFALFILSCETLAALPACRLGRDGASRVLAPILRGRRLVKRRNQRTEESTLLEIRSLP